MKRIGSTLLLVMIICGIIFFTMFSLGYNFTSNIEWKLNENAIKKGVSYE